jgi:holo-[acyl-carrier protein] synthase
MIAGVGIDLVDIDGLRQQLADTASSFAQGVFTADERRDSERDDPVRHLAARWAAKEAFLKAWASSRRGEAPVLPGVDLRDIEVARDPWGRPSLLLHGRVAAAFGAEHRCHLSLTHDGAAAAAVVVVETLS